MNVAKKSGMELDAFWHFIRASAGNSFLWETCGPNVFRGDFHDSFALELACKDIRLFAEMAKDVEVIEKKLKLCLFIDVLVLNVSIPRLNILTT